MGLLLSQNGHASRGGHAGPGVKYVLLSDCSDHGGPAVRGGTSAAPDGGVSRAQVVSGGIGKVGVDPERMRAFQRRLGSCGGTDRQRGAVDGDVAVVVGVHDAAAGAQVNADSGRGEAEDVVEDRCTVAAVT